MCSLGGWAMPCPMSIAVPSGLAAEMRALVCCGGGERRRSRAEAGASVEDRSCRRHRGRPQVPGTHSGQVPAAQLVPLSTASVVLCRRFWCVFVVCPACVALRLLRFLCCLLALCVPIGPSYILYNVVLLVVCNGFVNKTIGTTH